MIDWPSKALELGERLPPAAWHPQVLDWVQRHPAPRTAGVACSGGADSLCLLLLLWAHLPEWRSRLKVLHFDHRLRGEASRADARFVEDVARSLDLRVRTGTWNRAEGESGSEDAARRARFSFMQRELSGETEKNLFLGHQRDDIVESQLMRLSRGSGTGGLAAPRPVHALADGRVHLRPLLALEGTTIRRVLGELGIPFRIDVSNDGLGFYRNRIRLEVIPLWQKQSPFDVSGGGASSRELLQEDDDALEVWLRETVPVPVAGADFDLRPLEGKPRALLRRALREWTLVEGVAENLSRVAFEQLLEAAADGKSLRASAGTGVFLDLEAGYLRKERPLAGRAPVFGEPWPLPPGGTIFFPAGRELRAEVFPLDPATRSFILRGEVDEKTTAFARWEGGALRVRHRESGDRFRPLGAPGSRKLQDIFVDMKIPEVERHSFPVVLLDSQILWMPSLPPAEAFKINATTKLVVRLTYNCGEAV